MLWQHQITLESKSTVLGGCQNPEVFCLHSQRNSSLLAYLEALTCVWHGICPAHFGAISGLIQAGLFLISPHWSNLVSAPKGADVHQGSEVPTAKEGNLYWLKMLIVWSWLGKESCFLVCYRSQTGKPRRAASQNCNIWRERPSKTHIVLKTYARLWQVLQWRFYKTYL